MLALRFFSYERFFIPADRLFATLDPTTRRALLPSGSPMLVTDTVGFIKDLPVELVDAFQATLEEVGGPKRLGSFSQRFATARDKELPELPADS